MLKATPDIDIVLVAIMLAAMDGYAAMRAMRGLASSPALPILALTAM